MTAGTYQRAVPKGISAVPNGNILDVSGRCPGSISPVSKRAITQFLDCNLELKFGLPYKNLSTAKYMFAVVLKQKQCIGN